MESTRTIKPSASGIPLIVTAPSGAGKSSLLEALVKLDADIGVSISHTTRAPRLGEVDGREYHFMTVPSFLQQREKGTFLEWAYIHGNYYGTCRHAILEQLASGKDTVLEVDWQGAAQIRRILPGAISIFILPPSIEDLQIRLYKRGQDTPEVIAERIKAASGEISQVLSFDYVIINDDFDLALSQLAAIVKAARCRLSQQTAIHATLFEQFGIVPGTR